MPSAPDGTAPPRMEQDLGAAQLPRDDLTDDALLRSLHFRGSDLRGRSARLVDVEGCHLDQVGLADTMLEKVTISDCVIDGCDLANSRFGEASMFRTVLRQTRLTGWDVSGGVLRHVRFESCTGGLASLRFARLEQVEFVGCSLTQVDFHGAGLEGALFDDCDLTGAQLSHAQMRGARLVSCRLDGVQGVESLAGTTIAAHDVLALAYALAGALDITIADTTAEDAQ